MIGIVQGVGFRPFVARLAAQLELGGFVRNTTSAVVIEVEGAPAALDAFAIRIERERPPASTIEHLESEDIEPHADRKFKIVESARGENFAVGLPPDLAICPDCCREMDDPNDRRYRYPFLNCTACGPRYSIVEGLPYDRPLTTMRHFPFCDACKAEYENPADRRYHAQPIACPNCGPELEFVGGGIRATGENAIRFALLALQAGQVGAVRGIGGFHLACDPRNAAAVDKLRARKARGDQPFALMVRDLPTARRYVEFDDQSAGLLTSVAAPIVLLPKVRPETVLAPGNGYLGVMLPYSPLHRLLLREMDALVMTSGNRHGEPIVTGNQWALENLADLADFFLLHDREICAPSDDSVVRLYRRRPLAIRRGRGYAPFQLQLPVSSAARTGDGSRSKSRSGTLRRPARLYESSYWRYGEHRNAGGV